MHAWVSARMGEGTGAGSREGTPLTERAVSGGMPLDAASTEALGGSVRSASATSELPLSSDSEVRAAQLHGPCMHAAAR